MTANEMSETVVKKRIGTVVKSSGGRGTGVAELSRAVPVASGVAAE